MMTKLDLFHKKDDDYAENNITEEDSTFDRDYRPSHYNTVRNAYISALSEKDKSFGKCFAQTQLFLSYYEDYRIKK